MTKTFSAPFCSPRTSFFFAPGRAETQADLPEEGLARQHTHGGFERISRERQKSRTPAMDTGHVGSPGVAAALRADIAAEEGLGREDR